MVNIIGIYRIKAREPVHLVEIEIQNCQGMFDLLTITQEDSSQPQSNWQVPYMEHILNTEGTKILADDLDASGKSELWKGDVRIVFFFHYLNTAKPLRTPFGEVPLPKESKLPKRLRIIKYESPG
jgi:hypothetical protein